MRGGGGDREFLRFLGFSLFFEAMSLNYSFFVAGISFG